MPITSTAASHGPVPWTSRGRSGAGWGDHPDAAPARLVRPDHDRQARRSYSPAGARPTTVPRKLIRCRDVVRACIRCGVSSQLARVVGLAA
jgi:hypothetical protein